jgi:ABC-type xylose transport system permease subunit
MCEIVGYIPVYFLTIKMVPIVLLLIVAFRCVNGARMQRLKFGRDFGASGLGNIKAGGSRPLDTCLIIVSHALFNCILRAALSLMHRTEVSAARGRRRAVR